MDSSPSSNDILSNRSRHCNISAFRFNDYLHYTRFLTLFNPFVKIHEREVYGTKMHAKRTY